MPHSAVEGAVPRQIADQRNSSIASLNACSAVAHSVRLPDCAWNHGANMHGQQITSDLMQRSSGCASPSLQGSHVASTLLAAASEMSPLAAANAAYVPNWFSTSVSPLPMATPFKLIFALLLGSSFARRNLAAVAGM